MLKYIILFCLFSSTCFAQDTVQQKLEVLIGKLLVENINLSVQNESLTKQNTQMIEQLKKLEPKKDDK